VMLPILSRFLTSERTRRASAAFLSAAARCSGVNSGGLGIGEGYLWVVNALTFDEQGNDRSQLGRCLGNTCEKGCRRRWRVVGEGHGPPDDEEIGTLGERMLGSHCEWLIVTLSAGSPDTRHHPRGAG